MEGKAPPANHREPHSNFPNFCLCSSGPALQWKASGEGSASHHRFPYADGSLQIPSSRHINTEAGSHGDTLNTPRRGGSLTAERLWNKTGAKRGREADTPLLPAGTRLSSQELPVLSDSRGMLQALSDAVNSPRDAGRALLPAARSAHIQPGCGCPEERLPCLPRRKGWILWGGSPVVWGLLEPRQSGRDAVAERAEPSLSIPRQSGSPGRRARRWILRPAAPPHQGHACGDKASPTRVRLTPPGPQPRAVDPIKRKDAAPRMARAEQRSQHLAPTQSPGPSRS